jgi:hypothetical protein
MDQTLINIILGVAGFLCASVMGAYWMILNEVQKELSDLKVLMAGRFVRQEKFDRLMESIFLELKTISVTLANKADRHD